MNLIKTDLWEGHKTEEKSKDNEDSDESESPRKGRSLRLFPGD
jgi:hypothetical protein